MAGLALRLLLAANLVCVALPGPAAGQEPPGSNLKDVLDAILNVVRPDNIDALSGSRFRAADDEVRSLLSWSGKSGVAIEVPVAISVGELTHYQLVGDGLRVIGPGDNLTDALVQTYDGPGQISAQPPAGFRYSVDDSYYVWATKGPNGRLVYSPNVRGSNSVILGQVREALARKAASTSALKSSNVELQSSILKYYGSVATSAAEKARAFTLQKEITDLFGRISTNESLLAEELARQKKLSDAAAIVGRISAVLTFAATMSSTLSSIDAKDRASIKAAQNQAELEDLLKSRAAAAKARAARTYEAYKADMTEYRRQMSEVEKLGRDNGVPNPLIIRLKPPPVPPLPPPLRVEPLQMN